MAATVFLSESNGAGETVTDNITNLNMGSADEVHLTPATRPIVIPSSAGSETPKSSFLKFFRIKLQSLGGSNTITNLKFWRSAGVLKTGETVQGNCDDGGGGGTGRMWRANYHTPFAWKGSGNAPQYTPANIATSAPTTANVSIDANGAADDSTFDTVSGTFVAPQYSQYIVMFTLITNATPAGALNQKTFTVQYDEA